MGKGRAVCDTGPLLHLHEIGSLGLLELFEVVAPPAVVAEAGGRGVQGVDRWRVDLSAREKDRAAVLVEKFEIQLGEAEALAVGEARGIRLVLTDDLEARRVAEALELEPHGTVGIVLRGLREGMLTPGEAAERVRSLQQKSSLFLTSGLVERILAEIQRWGG